MKLICVRTTINFVEGDIVSVVGYKKINKKPMYILKGEDGTLDIVPEEEYNNCFDRGRNLLKQNGIEKFSKISDDKQIDFVSEEYDSEEKSILDISLTEFMKTEGLNVQEDYTIKDECIYDNKIFKEANKLYKNKDYKSAIELYKSLIEKHDCTQLYYNIGVCYLEEGYYAVSARYLEYAYNMAVMNCNRCFAYNSCYNKITCLLKCQRVDEAKIELQKLNMLVYSSEQKEEIKECSKRIKEMEELYNRMIDNSDNYDM